MEIPSLLTLPPNCRRLVFHYSRVPHGRFINLSGVPLAKRGVHQRDFHEYDWYVHGRSFGDTLTLLLTCRDLSADVATFVYSNNVIFCSSSRDSTFSALRALRPSSIGAIMDLVVQVYESPPQIDELTDKLIKRCTVGSETAPVSGLRLSKEKDKARLHAWSKTWTDHLVPHLSGGKARFRLICDTVNLETALVVAEPLFAMTPGFFPECGIRLAPTNDEQITHLCSTLVDHLTNTQKPIDRIAFESLPEELQKHTLSYTDLVSRHREVEWTPTTNYRMSNNNHSCYPDEYELHGAKVQCSGLLDGEHTADIQVGQRPFKMDFSMIDSSYDNNMLDNYFNSVAFEPGCDPARFIPCREHPMSWPAGCFCARDHSAACYPAVCTCWRPPTNMFLVSKRFRANALEIFFTKNRFIVGEAFSLDRSPRDRWEAFPFLRSTIKQPKELPVCIFIQQVIPRSALENLRFLELVFPAFGTQTNFAYIDKGSEAWTGWENTISLLGQHAKLSALTLSVYFYNQKWPDADYPSGTWRKDITAEQEQACRESVRELLMPLCRLGPRLHRFFAKLPYAGRGSRRHDGFLKAMETDLKLADGIIYTDGYEKVRYRLQEEYEGTVSFEKEVERTIMGPDYDAEAAGKFTARPYEWKKLFDFCEPFH